MQNFETPKWFERQQKEKKERIKNALESIHIDFQMIVDGVDPDPAEFQASIENVELIAKELGIEINPKYGEEE